MHRSTAYFAILHPGNWYAFADCNRYADDHCYWNCCNLYACAYYRNGYIHHSYGDIYARRSCNRDPDTHRCNEYAHRFCNQYCYSHLNSHKHTNTLIIGLLEKP